MTEQDLTTGNDLFQYMNEAKAVKAQLDEMSEITGATAYGGDKTTTVNFYDPAFATQMLNTFKTMVNNRIADLEAQFAAL